MNFIWLKMFGIFPIRQNWEYPPDNLSHFHIIVKCPETDRVFSFRQRLFLNKYPYKHTMVGIYIHIYLLVKTRYSLHDFYSTLTAANWSSSTSVLVWFGTEKPVRGYLQWRTDRPIRHLAWRNSQQPPPTKDFLSRYLGLSSKRVKGMNMLPKKLPRPTWLRPDGRQVSAARPPPLQPYAKHGNTADIHIPPLNCWTLPVMPRSYFQP